MQLQIPEQIQMHFIQSDLTPLIQQLAEKDKRLKEMDQQLAAALAEVRLSKTKIQCLQQRLTEFEDLKGKLSAMKTWIPKVKGSHSRSRSEPTRQQHKLMEENSSLKTLVEDLQQKLKTFEFQIDAFQLEKRELARENSDLERERDLYHQQSCQLQCDLKRTKGTLQQRESKLMQIERDQIDENYLTAYQYRQQRQSLTPMHSRTMFIENSLCFDDNASITCTESQTDPFDITLCPEPSYRRHLIQQSSTAFEYNFMCIDTDSDFLPSPSLPRSCTRD